MLIYLAAHTNDEVARLALLALVADEGRGVRVGRISGVSDPDCAGDMTLEAIATARARQAHERMPDKWVMAIETGMCVTSPAKTPLIPDVRWVYGSAISVARLKGLEQNTEILARTVVAVVTPQEDGCPGRLRIFSADVWGRVNRTLPAAVALRYNSDWAFLPTVPDERASEKPSHWELALQRALGSVNLASPEVDLAA